MKILIWGEEFQFRKVFQNCQSTHSNRYSAVQKSSDTHLRDEKQADLVAFLKQNLKFFLP